MELNFNVQGVGDFIEKRRIAELADAPFLCRKKS
jgi:hypothetical protein